MKKDLFAIVTPDPNEEATSQIVRASQLVDVFDAGEDHDGETYQVKFVWRTEKWFEKVPEMG